MFVKTISVILMTIVPFFTNAQSIVIGNSGDGYILRNENKIWLRDLLEYSITDKDDIIPQINNRGDLLKTLKVLDNSFSTGLILNNVNLANRIQALEFIHPLLPSIFTEALSKYNWVVLDVDLIPIPMEEDFFYVDGHRVQIANRHGNVIRISKNAWDRMSDLNKSALIFHEVIFSLMKVQYNAKEKYYYQSSRRTREIIGLLFSTHFQPNHKVKDNIYNIFENDLEIPFKKISKRWYTKNPVKVFTESYQARYGLEVRIKVKLSSNEVLCRAFKESLSENCNFLFTENTGSLSFN